MRTLILSTFSGLLFSGIAFSQVSTNVRNDQNLAGANLMFTKSESGAKPTGSPYFDETFRAVKLSDGPLTPVRYNAYSDRLEYTVGEETRMVVPEKDSLVVTTDKRYAYVFTDYTLDGVAQEGYLLFLGNFNKLNLYAKHRVTLTKESQPSNGYQTYRPANYKKAPVVYLVQIDGKSAVEMPVKKKELIKMFPGKDADISAYFSKNKVSAESNDDMVKLAGFLSTIL